MLLSKGCDQRVHASVPAPARRGCLLRTARSELARRTGGRCATLVVLAMLLSVLAGTAGQVALAQTTEPGSAAGTGLCVRFQIERDASGNATVQAQEVPCSAMSSDSSAAPADSRQAPATPDDMTAPTADEGQPHAGATLVAEALRREPAWVVLASLLPDECPRWSGPSPPAGSGRWRPYPSRTR